MKQKSTYPLNFLLTLLLSAALCVLLVVCGIDSASAQQEQNQKPESTVRGRVVYEGTSRPVRRARVMLVNLEARGPERGGLTNSNGEFRIGEVPAGRYFAFVDAPGLVSPVSYVAVEELRSDTLGASEIRKHFEEFIIDGKGDKEITVTARRGAALSGKVTYSDGEPAIGIIVHILRRHEGRLSKILVGFNRSSLSALRTDDRGFYRISGLPAGEYVVGVSERTDHGSGTKSDSDEYMVESYFENFSNQQLLMSFHPSATSAKEATAVTVDAGDEREGVDITIADRALRTIEGVVRGARDKKLVARAKINIVRRSDDMISNTVLPYSESMNLTQTDEEGRWMLKEIPDGDYTISVVPPEEYETRAETSMSGATTTTVTTNSNRDVAEIVSRDRYAPPKRVKRYAPARKDVHVSGDISELAVELGEGGRVSGTIVAEGGKKFPDYSQIYATPLGQKPESVMGEMQPSAQVYNGEFMIEGMSPGKYFLNPSTYDGDGGNLYVKSITWNGKDLLREPLEIADGSHIQGVRIILSSGRATLEVSLKPREDEAFPPAILVLLVPADLSGWSPFSTQQFSCSTNSNGACKIMAAPGDYSVVALPRERLNRSIEEEIRIRAASAPRVTLRANEKKSLSIAAPAR